MGMIRWPTRQMVQITYNYLEWWCWYSCSTNTGNRFGFRSPGLIIVHYNPFPCNHILPEAKWIYAKRDINAIRGERDRGADVVQYPIHRIGWATYEFIRYGNYIVIEELSHPHWKPNDFFRVGNETKSVLLWNKSSSITRNLPPCSP